jgi:hypothetical protein
MEPEIELLIAVAEQMPMHAHITELLEVVRKRYAARSAPVDEGGDTSGVGRMAGEMTREPTGEIDPQGE